MNLDNKTKEWEWVVVDSKQNVPLSVPRSDFDVGRESQILHHSLQVISGQNRN